MDIRFDNILIPKIKRTKEGFLKGKAAVTRTGVFEYLNDDGSIRYELRHPDDIFNEKSLNSLKTIPITIEHPVNKLVTLDNAKNLMVGMTGEEVIINGDSIVTTLTFTHKEAIEVIKEGKRELSAGYTTTLIPETGVYKGKKYTHRQTDIYYNHISLVNQGRAGSDIRVNLDHKNKTSTQIIENKNMIDTNQKNIENIELTHVNLDKYIATIDQLKNENNELKNKLNQINIDSIVADKVRAKSLLLDKVNKIVNLDSNDLIDKSERQIMEDVIKRFDHEIDLEPKSDSYIEGRFDAIFEMQKENSENNFKMPNLNRQDSVERVHGFDQKKLLQKLNNLASL